MTHRALIIIVVVLHAVTSRFLLVNIKYPSGAKKFGIATPWRKKVVKGLACRSYPSMATALVNHSLVLSQWSKSNTPYIIDFPYPGGHDTKVSLPATTAKTASVCFGLSETRPISLTLLLRACLCIVAILLLTPAQ